MSAAHELVDQRPNLPIGATAGANDNGWETVRIRGVTYLVYARVEAGANIRRTLHAVEMVGLRRPRGGREFCAWVYEDGEYGDVTTCGWAPGAGPMASFWS